jgi:outer membrane receptor for ferrienterochelin and colicin
MSERLVRVTLLSGLSAWIIIGCAGAAQAQDAQSQNDAQKSDKTSQDKSTTTVTVKGKKPTSTIDKQIYDVSKDPDSKTGTASDALNKVPGVVADSEGNVTYRGKAVTIYLNGHPSLMLQGDNRGIALQSMPSAYIGSVEVISNPGAQYGSAAGGGPILNIVTTHVMPAGGTLAITPKLRSDGGGSLDGSIFYHAGKLTVMAFVGDTERRNRSRSDRHLQSFDATGALTSATTSSSDGRTRNSSPHLFSNFEYNLTKDDVLSGQLMDFSGRGRSHSTSGVASYDGAGAAINVYKGQSDDDFTWGGPQLNLNWMHYGLKPDETLKINLQVSGSKDGSSGDSSNVYQASSLPQNTGVRVNRYTNSTDKQSGEFSLDYNTPVGDDQLATGVQVDVDSSHATNESYGPDDEGATPTLNSLLSRDFRYHQTISAAYVTWQRELGAKWTVLAGLRAEQLDLNTEQRLTGATTHVADTHLNPSFYATYLLSHDAKLRFNYSHRLQRPTPEDYDVSLNYGDNGWMRGNTHLKPQTTDAFEANYEYAHEALSWSIRGFYQQNSDVITSSSHFIPNPDGTGDPVLETTRGNDGSGDSGGVQLTWNNRIKDKLNLTMSATAAQDHVRAPAVPGTQSLTAVSGNINLSWTPTKKDFLAVRYQRGARSLTGEGYTSAFSQGGLNYSHRFGKLSLTLDVENLFQGKRMSVTRTPIASSVSWMRLPGPVLSIGLRRSFKLGAGG